MAQIDKKYGGETHEKITLQQTLNNGQKFSERD